MRVYAVHAHAPNSYGNFTKIYFFLRLTYVGDWRKQLESAYDADVVDRMLATCPSKENPSSKSESSGDSNDNNEDIFDDVFSEEDKKK